MCLVIGESWRTDSVQKRPCAYLYRPLVEEKRPFRGTHTMQALSELISLLRDAFNEGQSTKPGYNYDEVDGPHFQSILFISKKQQLGFESV